MCDALIFMNAGTVIHDGNMEDLLHRQTESGYAFEIRTAGDNTASLRNGWPSAGDGTCAMYSNRK